MGRIFNTYTGKHRPRPRSRAAEDRLLRRLIGPYEAYGYAEPDRLDDLLEPVLEHTDLDQRAYGVAQVY